MKHTKSIIKLNFSKEKGKGVNIFLDGSRPFYTQNISRSIYLNNLYVNHEREIERYRKYIRKILDKVKEKLERAILEKKEITFVTSYGNTLFTEIMLDELKKAFPEIEFISES